MLSWGISAPPNGPKKVDKGSQVGGMYVSMSKLENKPLTKSLGPQGEIVQNNQKIASLCCFGAFGHPLIDPQKVHRGLKVGRMYVPMFRLENRPLTISLDRSLRRNGPEQPQNTFFVLFRGIWVPPNEPEKVHTDPLVGGMYVSVSKLENWPLTQSIGPFL
jgi:hypothetical protein